MTFSYDSSLFTSKDRVRFRTGDTDSTVTPQLADEEIEATLASQPDFSEAMAICAESLAAKYMRMATSKQAASLKVDYSKRVDYLLGLAKRLRTGIEAIENTDLIITGTTKTELSESAVDTDLVQNRFHAGQFDNPSASQGLEEIAG